jgi:hypothetical protein
VKRIAFSRAPRAVFKLRLLLLATVSLNSVVGHSASNSAACLKVGIEGEVSAGKEWAAPFGQGWVFRILPIQAAAEGYSGWDLVVDRSQPAGYPDALLLATMPYNSINEREIGTTYGLRSQDAIGWNPRSFHFLADPSDFREGQDLFKAMIATESSTAAPDKARNASRSHPHAAKLLELQKRAAAGEFRILDAHIVPGVGDPESYAQAWASASSRTPHKVESAPGGKSSPRGSLNGMQFSIALWLPASWKLAPGLHALPAACPD